MKKYFHKLKIVVIYNIIDAKFLQNIAKKNIYIIKKKYNLPDEFILTVGHQEKRKNFFSKLFGKKDRVTQAKKFLKKEAKKKNELKKPTNLRFRRLLIYLLFVLLVVLSIFLTPHRAHLEMAYPSLSAYFDIVNPLYKQFMLYFPL